MTSQWRDALVEALLNDMQMREDMPDAELVRVAFGDRSDKTVWWETAYTVHRGNDSKPGWGTRPPMERATIHVNRIVAALVERCDN